MRRAFTLIELLVVISIIALLIAILLPVLGAARQTARQMQCAANSRGLGQNAVTMAVDHDGLFRLTHRDLSEAQAFIADYDSAPGLPLDHISWIPRHLGEEMEQTGFAIEEFTCPERGVEYIKRDDKGNANRWRMGYFLMSGRHSESFTAVDGRVWRSPRTMEGPSDLVLTADVTERGTFTPPVATASHGLKGLVSGPQYATPEELRVSGTNVGYVDGSVVFEPVNNTREFTSSEDGRVTGYWPDSESYKNP